MKNLKWLLLNTKYWFISLLHFIKHPLTSKVQWLPDDLWANWYWPMEADPRDFKVENVLWAPSQDELNKIPNSVNLLLKALPQYYNNQTCVPSCTASSLANYITVSECLERDMTWILADQKDLRSNMKHKWVCKWEHWDYLETALKTLKKFKPDRPIDFIFIDGGHSIDTIQSDWDNIKKFIHLN